MGITAADVIGPILTDEEIQECISVAQILLKSVQDRGDLHSRSTLERFIDIVMGEIAEQSVIKWIRSQGKFANSDVDKESGRPDKGHDIILHSKNGYNIKCSVKSSLSVYRNQVENILEEFNLSSKRSEVQGINIQVYFWLDLNSTPRITIPSNNNMAIIGWLGRKELNGISEEIYSTEARSVINVKLKNMRSMRSLLDILQ